MKPYTLKPRSRPSDQVVTMSVLSFKIWQHSPQDRKVILQVGFSNKQALQWSSACRLFIQECSWHRCTWKRWERPDWTEGQVEPLCAVPWTALADHAGKLWMEGGPSEISRAGLKIARPFYPLISQWLGVDSPREGMALHNVALCSHEHPCRGYWLRTVHPALPVAGATSSCLKGHLGTHQSIHRRWVGGFFLLYWGIIDHKNYIYLKWTT